MRIEIIHKISEPEVRKRLDELIARTRIKYPATTINFSWINNMGMVEVRMLGIRTVGKVITEHGRFIVEYKLPLTALPLSSKIKEEITKQIKTLVHG